MDQKIAVIGSGATGCATAAYLGLNGWEVTLCDTEEQAEDFPAIRSQGGIYLEGALGAKYPYMPCCMTTDFEQALRENRRIIVCVSYGRQEEIARRCGPYVREDHVFLLSPGNLGSVIMRRHFKENSAIGELSGNLWACRRKRAGVVTVALPLGTVRAAAYPSEDYPRLENAFGDVFSMERGENIIEAALNSPNVTSHLAGAVLNAVSIERKNKEFCLFMDGMGQVLVECIDQLEEERDRVLRTAGLQIYKDRSRGLMERIMEYGSHPELDIFRSLDGPSDFSHRYVAEDASCGVAMLISLARHYGVPVALTEAFFQISGRINRTDYGETGRTLENLRLQPDCM
ncbi:MAG: NAD/NADP octopine/nopaline dehydrogenase family protein [Enterocloster asparagiformis]|nr:NAD/NADP octopine/nopaline dehydrogenase family protein [Enterocloster asparagiformis]